MTCGYINKYNKKVKKLILSRSREIFFHGYVIDAPCQINNVKTTIDKQYENYSNKD